MNVERLQQRYAGRQMRWLASCATTMTEAAAMAAAGAPHGSFVGADEQTAGQGRLGRRWLSEPGTNLAVSFILRPTDAGLLTLALGLAVREAILSAANLDCDLRWPNDALLGGRKVCGILVNASSDGYVAGIGINVNQQVFPPEVAELATSLRLAAAREISQEALLVALVEAIDQALALSRDQVRDRFTAASSFAFGKRVLVEQAGEAIRGVTDGLDEAGYLWVRRDDGARVMILAGGVREVPQEKPWES